MTQQPPPGPGPQDSPYASPPPPGYGYPPSAGYAYAPPPAYSPYATESYAPWASRVGAYLLDYLLILPGWLLGVVMAVVGYALMIGLTIWNRYVRAGRTGQSWGKKVLGIRLVRESDGQPIGAGMAYLRDLAHIVDGFFYLGYLWPLWDARRQTFADKICSTVILARPT
ncbi:MAG TPA: RDD family protein [Lapillicoccus sp.]|nr:RDD family protein [Lapillicoccus sp.]